MKIKLTIAILLSCASHAFAQKQVMFYGGRAGVFDHPVKKQNGKYSGYYKHSNFSERGRLILNTSTKTLTIKWLNGETWQGKYAVIEYENNQYEPLVGKVNYKVFKGHATNGEDFVFYLKKSLDGVRCTYLLKTGRIVDEYYKLDTWKLILDFSTTQDCID